MTDRGHSKPPADLGELIALVNAEGLFDPECTLPDASAPIDVGSRFVGLDEAAWIRKCYAVVNCLSQRTREFLGPPEKLARFLERYGLLQDAQRVLLAIARWSQGQTEQVFGSAPLFHDPAQAFPVSVNVSLWVNEKGCIAHSENRMLDMLVGVAANHIRACQICRRIFWAPRVNSECCGQKCRKTFNQRNSRSISRKRKFMKSITKKGR